MENKGLPESIIRDFKKKQADANRRMERRLLSDKKDRLKGNVTYYNVKAFEAYERGDYEMAADYTELVRRNLERLAELS